MGQALLREQVGGRRGARAERQGLGDVVDEVLEIRTASHGGTFAFHLNHRPDPLGQVGVDGEPAGGGLAIGPQGLRLHTLLPQPLNSLFGVAAA
jgi:hypothetical protein